MTRADSSSFPTDDRFVSIKHESHQIVVRLRGEHDISNAAALREILAEATSRSDRNVVLDLSAVTFMGAATLSVLIWARELLAEQSRCWVLRSPSQCVRRLFEVCGLAEFFDHHRA